MLAVFHNIKYEDVVENLKKNKPHVILLAGDVIYGKDLERTGFTFYPGEPILMRFHNAVELLRQVSTIAPTYFAFGNHEWCFSNEDIRNIEMLNVTVLDNCWKRLDELVIGGLSSPDYSQYRIFEEYWRQKHSSDTRGNLRSSFFYWKTHRERRMNCFPSRGQ